MTYTDYSIEYLYYSNGFTYTLNGSNTISTRLGSQSFAFSYLGDQGFGLAPMHRITTRGPLQHGDSDIDFRLDPRILQIPLVVKNESTAAPVARHYSTREALLKIFQPGFEGILTVRIGTRVGVTVTLVEYRINVRVLGGMTFDVDPQDYHVRTVVQLRADDPTWYEPTVAGDLFSFIYPNANINGLLSTTVGGNWSTFPIIRINGPITNPTITNSSYNQIIAITATIGVGTYLDIDLSYGKKTVVDNSGANRISTVSAASNLATWAFRPGSNTIAITGTGNTAATNVVFSYYNRYTGI